ncbi:MAG: hypothetical protein BZY88_01600 [SAR202 cluster bacterium Io17-Chloro-G9]|nr:MAG: hypothetical protein BZY88_01600 [SAR202 cluster bacterium Io17-Chloro-G9]
MTNRPRGHVLLALDAGVRETGWAVFNAACVVTQNGTGVIKAPAPRRSVVSSRVNHLLIALDGLVEQWQPSSLAHSRPSGIHWPVPALELLEIELARWARGHRLPLHAYTAQEVRSAIAGQANASQDALAYATMEQLGLIGQSKTTHEWEALAVGYYHLGRARSQAA